MGCITDILPGLPLSPTYVLLITVNSLSAKWRIRLGTRVETNFTREKLVLFMRPSRKAYSFANGSFTCSSICDSTYLGITLSDAVSLPYFKFPNGIYHCHKQYTNVYCWQISLKSSHFLHLYQRCVFKVVECSINSSIWMKLSSCKEN